MTGSMPRFRIEVPLPRRWLLARTAVAALFAAALAALAASASGPPARALAVGGGVLFAALARDSWRLRRSRSPLVVDQDGLVLGCRGGGSRIDWGELRSVRLRKRFGRRLVVLRLGGLPVREVALHPSWLGDVPPEWWAGSLEILRRRARHARAAAAPGAWGAEARPGRNPAPARRAAAAFRPSPGAMVSVHARDALGRGGSR